MKHTFEGISEPLDIDHGVEGVGKYSIYSVTIEFDTDEEDDTIGYVPYGNRQVFHPGGGVYDVADEESVDVTEIWFGDADGEHHYQWAGTFKDAPSPMPLNEEQINKIRDAA